MTVTDDVGYDRSCSQLMLAVRLMACLTAIAGVLVFLVMPPARDLTLHVLDKKRVCTDSHDDCTYLIYAREGTFEDTNSLLAGKSDSPYIYAQIEPGRAYVAHVRGWRNHPVSAVENIVSVKER